MAVGCFLCCPASTNSSSSSLTESMLPTSSKGSFSVNIPASQHCEYCSITAMMMIQQKHLCGSLVLCILTARWDFPQNTKKMQHGSLTLLTSTARCSKICAQCSNAQHGPKLSKPKLVFATDQLSC
jgi:hypothetical protein